MDQQPGEFKTTNKIICELEKITVLSDPLVLKPNKEIDNLGDFEFMELESLKKEHVHFDEKEQIIRMHRGVSSPETEVKKELKSHIKIENNGMVSTDIEYSSDYGSNSYSQNDNVSEITFKIKVEQEEYPNLKPIDVEVKTEINTKEFGSLELENLNSDYSEDGEIETKGITVKVAATEKFPLKLSDGIASETEAESAYTDIASKSREVGVNPLVKKENSLDVKMEFLPKFPYRNSANPFEVVVPFVGKRPDWGDCKPIPHSCDSATTSNRVKFEQERNDGCHVTETSYHEMMKKRQARSNEQVEEDERRELLMAGGMAVYVVRRILTRILLQMQRDKPDEEAIIRYFKRFLGAPVSPIVMLYIPQFVHTVMYIRGSKDFTRRVRKMAERCYFRVHVMFPIPEGYNFETVYTSEVKKFLPEGIDGLHDYAMEYEELSSSDESEDYAFSDDS